MKPDDAALLQAPVQRCAVIRKSKGVRRVWRNISLPEYRLIILGLFERTSPVQMAVPVVADSASVNGNTM